MANTQRVVITGMGLVSPLGSDLDRFWQALISGKSGIATIDRFDPSAYTTKIAGQVNEFDPQDYMGRKEARRMDRFAQFAMAAAELARRHAGLSKDGCAGTRCGTMLGTGVGGMETLTDQFEILQSRGPGRISPFFVPMMIANMAAGQIGIAFGLKGPSSTVVTACAASANAIGDAFRVLQRGDADLIFAGGSEAAIVPLAFAGFCAMKAMSTRNDDPTGASRPFDRDRDGFVMSEGSGMVILETLEHAHARGAQIFAEIVGYGNSADAHHITDPAPGGEGGARSMQAALDDAGLKPEDIEYISAHGTSTPPNDRNETQAIKTVFGAHSNSLMVSSIKSMVGHLLGAAGVVELIAGVLTIQNGIVPPTINYVNRDEACDLDYVPNNARKAEVSHVLSNSFGFGGQNASLIIKRWEGR